MNDKGKGYKNQEESLRILGEGGVGGAGGERGEGGEGGGGRGKRRGVVYSSGSEKKSQKRKERIRRRREKWDWQSFLLFIPIECAEVCANLRNGGCADCLHWNAKWSDSYQQMLIFLFALSKYCSCHWLLLNGRHSDLDDSVLSHLHNT